MTHEEALAIVNRYNRFNVVMELLIETLGTQEQPKTLGDLASEMKKLQKDYEEATQMIRNTLTGEPETKESIYKMDESTKIGESIENDDDKPF